jgi:hypothetical protein
MWSLWSSRNDRNHIKSSIPVRLAIDWVLDVCSQLILDTGKQTQTRTSRTEVKWQKPEAGFVKINTDGSSQAETLVGATEAMIKDDNGAFLKVTNSCSWLCINDGSRGMVRWTLTHGTGDTREGNSGI